MGKQRKAFRHGDRPALKQAGGRRALAGRHVPFMKERGDGRCGRMRAERFGKERAAVRRFLWQGDLKRELHGRKSCWPSLSKKDFPWRCSGTAAPSALRGPAAGRPGRIVRSSAKPCAFCRPTPLRGPLALFVRQ